MTKKQQKMNKKLMKIISSLVISTVIFFLIRPTFVMALVGIEGEDLLTDFSNTEVFVEEDEKGNRQIKYRLNGRKYNVTNTPYTNEDPESSGENMVWISKIGGFWQVMYHNALTNETIQLTSSGNNVAPKVSGNNIVWEGQVDGVWQVLLFDGTRISQLTSGDMISQDVDVDGNYVVYSQKSETEDGDIWTVYLYNIELDKTINLSYGGYGKESTISDGQVQWTALEGKNAITYYYDIATDTISTVRGDLTQSEESGLFDEQAFQEFVESLESENLLEVPTEPEEVTEEDIISEIGAETSADNKALGIQEENVEEVQESTQTTILN